MPFSITNYFDAFTKRDVVVIPSYSNLKKHPGMSEKVFECAGPMRLSMACRKGKDTPLGEAYVTDGFKSPFKYIIHLVCLSENKHRPVTGEDIKKGYVSALNAARDLGVDTVLIPLLKRENEQDIPEMYRIAYSTITRFVRDNDLDVRLYVERYKDLFNDGKYIEIGKFIQENWRKPETPRVKLSIGDNKPGTDRVKSDLDKRLGAEMESFSDYLIKLIDERGMSNSEVYLKANMSRQQFSRIISKKGYTPRKETIYALAVALKLSKDETEKLLKKAGRAFTETDKLDVIMLYFLEKKEYDLFVINDVLLYYGQSLLGSGM